MLRELDPEVFNVNPFCVYDMDWALLSVGDESDLNTMTISWGGMGTFWGKPVVTVYVGLGRCTKPLMDAHDTFSVCWLSKTPKAKETLMWAGTHHARDCEDKVSEAGLTPVFVDGTPTFKEAEVTIICRKAYADLMPRENFVDLDAEGMWYSERDDAVEDWHTMYIGYVEKILVGR